MQHQTAKLFNIFHKKSILLLLFIGFIPFHSIAQNGESKSSSVSINVNARVIESINMTTIRDMRFGKVQPGQEEIDISPLNNSNAGKMVATGRAEARISVSFIREWQLTNDRGGTPLTFFYRVSGNTVDEQSTAELLETDNRNLQFNSEGEFYFWIGGHVDITNASPGNYEGQFTIEIEYI